MDEQDREANEGKTDAHRENAFHATATTDEWSIAATETNDHLGRGSDDDPVLTPVKSIQPDDAEKMRIAEQWRRGEISENEARQLLGDDTVDGMIADRDAFREAIQRDTSDFLQPE